MICRVLFNLFQSLFEFAFLEHYTLNLIAALKTRLHHLRDPDLHLLTFFLLNWLLQKVTATIRI